MQKLQFRILVFNIVFGLKIHIATLLSYLYFRKNILHKTKIKELKAYLKAFFNLNGYHVLILYENMTFKIS
jgi:hypothetical protein